MSNTQNPHTRDIDYYEELKITYKSKDESGESSLPITDVELVFLLGAGASVPAGLPSQFKLTNDFERELKSALQIFSNKIENTENRKAEDFLSNINEILIAQGKSNNDGQSTENLLNNFFVNYYAENYKTLKNQKFIEYFISKKNEIEILHEIYFAFKSKSFVSIPSKRINGNKLSDNNKTTNLEIILATLRDFNKATDKGEKENPFYNLIGTWDREILQAVSGRKITYCIELEKLIALYVRKALTHEDAVANAKYLKHIFYLQENHNTPIKIFTLNHDLLIEEVHKDYLKKDDDKDDDKDDVGLRVGLRDGFESAKSIYNIDSIYDYEREKIEANSSNYHPVHLYKLHGSLNWYKDDKGGIRKEEKKGDQYDLEKAPELIFGASQKLRSEEPFNELFIQFKKSLTRKKPTILIVIGYSFTDNHIDDAIKSGLDKNCHLRIVINNPGFCETEYFSLPPFPFEVESSEGGEENIVYNDELNPLISVRQLLINSARYEEYLNLNYILHSVYYSRNYEEDAYFLYTLSQKKDKLETIFDLLGVSAVDKRKGIKRDHVLKAISGIGDCGGYVKSSEGLIKELKKGEFDSEENWNNIVAFIYNKVIFKYQSKKENLEPFEKISKIISALKIQAYKISNTAASNKDKEAAFALLDDIRLIDKFVKNIIPTHLILFYLYSRANYLYYEKAKTNNKPPMGESRASLLFQFEMYLKFNYFIEVIAIHLMDKNSNMKFLIDKITTNHSESRSKKFTELVEATQYQTMKNDLEELNKYLFDVKAKILVEKVTDNRYNSFVKFLLDSNKLTSGKTDSKSKVGNSRRSASTNRNTMGLFESLIFSLRDDIFDREKSTNKFKIKEKHKDKWDKLSVHDKRILYPSGSKEVQSSQAMAIMQAEFQLMAKGMLKSFVHRLGHRTIIKRAIIDMGLIFRKHSIERNEYDERFKDVIQEILNKLIRNEALSNSDRKLLELYKLQEMNNGSATINDMTDVYAKYKDDVRIEQINQKLEENLNWYFYHNLKVLGEFYNDISILSFNDHERGMDNNDYINKKLLGDEVKDEEINRRIKYKHHSSSVFLSKDLRHINLFKYYYTELKMNKDSLNSKIDWSPLK